MSRHITYKALQLLHRLTDRGLTLLFGEQFRGKYIPAVASLKTRLFPEYSAPIPVVPDDLIDIEPSEPMLQITIPPIPEWVLAEMKVLGRAIDPALYPTDAFIASCQYYAFPAIPKPGQIYEKLLQQCTVEHYVFCFAIPWVKRGGADLVTLKHIELAHKKAKGKVLVILTEQGDSPWLNRIPAGVDVLDFSGIISEVSHEEMLVILSRLLVQLQIDVLHIINSRHVWEIMCRNGLALRQRTKIFASIYCDDYDEYGRPVGFSRQYLGSCYQHITKIFSDNTAFPQLLQKTYGYKPSLFSILKSPVDIEHSVIANRKPIGHRVLWAGRLDRQKRPDLLASIAILMPDVEFYVYGDSVLESNSDALNRLEQLENVVMKGHFDGVESLPFNDFPVFLYTSQWDGTPTIVIAAALAAIPIVASCVGGVGDLINEKTGFPIRDIEDVSLYAAAIRYVLEHPAEAESLAFAAKKYVESEHTQAAFELALFNTEDYFNNNSSLLSSEGVSPCAV
jgi:glycosyltransferase involved in cell wall biosynthesis